MARLELCQYGVACTGSYNSLLLFLDMHAENSWGCANERVSDQMIFFTEGTWQGSHGHRGLESSANCEQCLVPLENCCFDAALLYGIIFRSSRQCVPPLSNNDAASSESESSLVKHRPEKCPGFQLASPWFENYALSWE